MKHLLTFITLVLSLLVISACGDGSNDNSDLCANYLYYIDGKCTCLDGKNQLGEVCTNPFDKPPVTDGDTKEDGDAATIDGDATITDGDTVDGDVVDDPNTITAHGITLSVVTIPAGSFKMGCSPDDTGCLTNEEPRHTVNISEFKMAKMEVTNSQYLLFLHLNGNDCANQNCLRSDHQIYYEKEQQGWIVVPEYINHPVRQVTLNGARAFCYAMGGRLPSEAEWEYAARAGTTTRYYCGDNLDCLEDIAWYVSNAKQETQHVCTKAANDFGLCDMLGNVWEWCEDSYRGGYTNAPTDGSVWFANTNSSHLSRGGSVNDLGDYTMRISYRMVYMQGQIPSDIGFRCAFSEEENFVEMNWLSIPGDSFEMGCSPDDDKCKDSELPRHTVDIPDFEMTQTEVTNDQYAQFLTENGDVCNNEDCWTENESIISYNFLDLFGDEWFARNGSNLYPMVSITYYGAKSFCEAAGGRLPSEAEWEYAARAGTTTKYYCGDDESCLDDIACDSYCPTGQNTPNDFDLHDMISNAAELTEDCYHENYEDAPSDGSAWITDCYATDEPSSLDSFLPVYHGNAHYIYKREPVSQRHYIGSEKSTHKLGFRCVRDPQ